MDLYIDRPENITISDVGNPCSSFGQAQKCGLYIHVHVAYVNELGFFLGGGGVGILFSV